MRKDHVFRRSKEADTTNDAAEVENGDPLSGSADPFDAILNSKPDESTSTRSNGKKVPSPIPDDSDTENETDKKTDDKVETNGDSAKPAEKTDSEGDGEGDGYEVEAIVAHKFKGKKKFFKIRWKNYSEEDDTWEPEEDLSCPEIIEQYLAEHPEANKSKEKKEKKVRISLPSEAPTRSTPKRNAAERKSVVDESDDDEASKKSSPGKRGRPSSKKGDGKRGRPKMAKSNKTTAKKEEYEVEKIVDDEMRAGKKYYRIRWKGWSAKDDTWEPKSSLSCPDIIKAYESGKKAADDQEYEVEKIVGEKIEHGKRYFLVKWKGWSEDDNSWEEEKKVNCYDLIEKFRDSCRSSGKSNKRAASVAQKSPKAKKIRTIDVSDDENDDDADDNGDGEKEWEVEKIINMRKARGGKKEYLIRWKGCKASEDTWEPEDAISSPDLIAAFLKKNKK